MTESMHTNTWQHLLGLESIDVVCDWHRRINDRQLSVKRASEITSSAKQAREYFRNAANSDNTVRPLLTFYGIASLARSALLLLKRGSGEESLARGHGLEALCWSNTLSGDLQGALKTIGRLKVRTSKGLFSDFVRETNNHVCMHVRSAAVDWRFAYEQPPLGEELALETLISTVPDLSMAISGTALSAGYAAINQMSYSEEDGFLASVNAKQFEAFRGSYIDLGYEVIENGDLWQVKCTSEIFQTSIPQFMHTYVHKMFHSIPALYIVNPVHKSTRFSQLAITYMLSYFLGMLTRYFPTHWIALHSSRRGDYLWPTLHATQKYVELVFPELTIELIHDILSQREAEA